MNWQNYFEYNAGQLYWKTKPSKRINIGQKAGSVNCQTGYVTIQFQGKIYQAHRIIWGNALWANTRRNGDRPYLAR